jgi:DNA mismatch endonuclease (patch repair protein)
MRRERSTPNYAAFRPASGTASRTARASSRKRDTAPEMLLRRACYALGLRYRVDARDLPGRPDLVFRSARVAVFVDGDFWHGRELEARLARLSAGHNAAYWVAKVSSNVARDRRNNTYLASTGWRVLRLWEGEVRRDPCAAAERVAVLVAGTRAAIHSV